LEQKLYVEIHKIERKGENACSMFDHHLYPGNPNQERLLEFAEIQFK